ncbi:serine hydrolase [Embleya sp. NPDC127516]|uniref:serine hydrolase n=1 Tax=Embleya sp. NPDC127516 TaxID=3363990 RepID=UPI00381DF7F0
MARRLRLDDLTAITVPAEPAVSPDGTRVVYTLVGVDAAKDRNVRSLWWVPTSGGEPQRLTEGPSDSTAVWSPDGTRVAFLRAVDGPPQLWVLPIEGGDARQVTRLPMGAGRALWSPDGTRVAFGAVIDTYATADEDESARAARAKAPLVIDRVDYQVDGAGMLGSLRRHVHVVDVASGEVTRVTEGAWNATDPAWSPDGTRLAYAAGPDADADLTMRSAAYVVDLATPAAPAERVGSAEGMVGWVDFTPDGESLLVLGAEQTRTGHTRILRVPLAGGPTVDLTGALDRNVMPGGSGYPGGLPQPTPDGRELLFCLREAGNTHLYALDLESGDARLVVGDTGSSVSGLSVSRSPGGVAFVLSTTTSYGEIAMVDPDGGTERVLTAHGTQALPDVELFTPIDRRFTTSDGTVVHGRLLRDPQVTGPTPLLLDIHGGPHNAWTGTADSVHLYHQELVARGWTILTLNPRASDGYGEDFYAATVGNWGTMDAPDFLEPLDELVAEGIADAQRLAVTGYSYGGYMTCYLTSRDQRFAAAVAGGVVSDLNSMAGTSDLGSYMGWAEFGGTPWDDVDLYTRSNPFTKVGDVRTPTLILQGAADVRCPLGQAQQWFGALRERDVPARMVLYPDGSHLFILDGPPSHRLDWNRRIVDWVERYAGSAGRTRPAPLDAAHWQRRLSTLAERHRIPGATLGILRLDEHAPDDLVEAAYGVLNRNTGVPVTADSVFQIGSITKLWTTTLAMQLVEDGLLDLDQPLIEVLPELRLSRTELAKQITMRHLLTHTSGIEGDRFIDSGRGDDCLARYVAGLEDAAQVFPPGGAWSYCNTGFNLAGRVIEHLTGKTWDQVLRERLSGPLGLERTITLPEEALLLRAAVGHVSQDGGDPQVAPVWMLPRSAGPAGLIGSTSAELLRFVRLHLADGVTADGKRLLGAEHVVAMREKHVDMPDLAAMDASWGLGWHRYAWDGHEVVGHDGGTIGQYAFLRVLPEQGLAVALLTNGGDAPELYEDLFREIFAEVAQVALPAPFAPPAQPPAVDPERYVGVYERAMQRFEVRAGAEGEGLVLRIELTGEIAESLPDAVRELPLVAVAEDLFAMREPGSVIWRPVTFGTFEGGGRYLFSGQVTPRRD